MTVSAPVQPSSCLRPAWMEPPSLVSPPLPPWERNLHSDASRSYPSNYVPPSLLALANASSISMRSPPPPRLAPLVRASLGISCALSCVAGFLAVFIGLRSETFEPADVIWGSVLLGGAGYMLDGGVLANNEGPQGSHERSFLPSSYKFNSHVCACPFQRSDANHFGRRSSPCSSSMSLLRSSGRSPKQQRPTPFGPWQALFLLWVSS